MDEIRQPMLFKIDIKSGLVEMPQRAVLMKGDKNANTVTAEIVDGDKQVDISSAAVTASFLIGGVKIPLTGETDGNRASVTLPEECYRESGRYEMRMMLSASDVTRTILYISGHMESDGEGGILDVEGVIPSVQDIIAQYATMQAVTAQTQAAADAALEAAKSANFTVLDRFGTYAQLIAAHPTGNAGEAFAVGTADNNVVYIWGIDTLAWVNIGPVQGAQGLKGDDGYSPTITVTDIVGGHRVTITDKNGTKNVDIMNGSADFNQQLNTTSDVTFKSVTAEVVHGAVFME